MYITYKQDVYLSIPNKKTFLLKTFSITIAALLRHVIQTGNFVCKNTLTGTIRIYLYKFHQDTYWLGNTYVLLTKIMSTYVAFSASVVQFVGIYILCVCMRLRILLWVVAVMSTHKLVIKRPRERLPGRSELPPMYSHFPNIWSTQTIMVRKYVGNITSVLYYTFEAPSMPWTDTFSNNKTFLEITMYFCSNQRSNGDSVQLVHN